MTQMTQMAQTKNSSTQAVPGAGITPIPKVVVRRTIAATVVELFDA